jgi:hypothetical protein
MHSQALACLPSTFSARSADLPMTPFEYSLVLVTIIVGLAISDILMSLHRKPPNSGSW